MIPSVAGPVHAKSLKHPPLWNVHFSVGPTPGPCILIRSQMVEKVCGPKSGPNRAQKYGGHIFGRRQMSSWQQIGHDAYEKE